MLKKISMLLIAVLFLGGAAWAQDEEKDEKPVPQKPVQAKPAPAQLRKAPAQPQAERAVPNPNQAEGSEASSGTYEVIPIPEKSWAGLQKAWAQIDEYRTEKLAEHDGEAKQADVEKQKMMRNGLRAEVYVGNQNKELADDQLKLAGDIADCLEEAGLMNVESENPELAMLKSLVKSRVQQYVSPNNRVLGNVQVMIRNRGQQGQAQKVGRMGVAGLEALTADGNDITSKESREQILQILRSMRVLAMEEPDWKEHRYVQLVVNLASGETYPAVVKADDALLAEIDELIENLGNADYATREEATQRLMEIGPPAFDKLKGALDSEVPEIQTRARQILGE